MTDACQRSMMDSLCWRGVPTLFRCERKGAEGQDIAPVGVAHSTGNGTTERDRHLGSRALRNISCV